MVGGIEIDSEVGALSVPHVLMDLYNKDGRSRPKASDIQGVLKNNSVAKKASQDLEKARVTLQAALCASPQPVTLSVTPDSLLRSEPDLQQTAAFNAALGAFRGAMGGAFRVSLVVKPTPAWHSQTVRFTALTPMVKVRRAGLVFGLGRKQAA